MGMNFMGIGWGWGWSWWGWGGDGEIFVGMGWGWGWCTLPCHSLLESTCRLNTRAERFKSSTMLCERLSRLEVQQSQNRCTGQIA